MTNDIIVRGVSHDDTPPTPPGPSPVYVRIVDEFGVPLATPDFGPFLWTDETITVTIKFPLGAS